ncbi:MAG: replication-relaxation family protein [Rhizobiales bacterium]|nr:replication-relaxation family protein [Hyphomicrobiales bacterium]
MPRLVAAYPARPQPIPTRRVVPADATTLSPSAERWRLAGLTIRYNGPMDVQLAVAPTRRPRFRRASQPPAFRLTNDDVVIIRQLARHRFLRSTHIAALVGRSLDRTNDRLSRLFHAGYIDRPRAQLDYYPTAGSAPIAYALADRGARLLIQRDGVDFANVEWSRKNRQAGRPFIEHQLEIVDFYVALQHAAAVLGDIRLIHPDQMVATFPDQSFSAGNPFALRVKVSHQGTIHEIAVVPDLVFGLILPDGSQRCFMVEIDCGTMPVIRSDISQTSFERKMRAYLTAHAARQHERHFGWKTFRVLTITTDDHRLRSMKETLRELRVAHSPGAPLFYFATRSGLCGSDPLTHTWRDGNDRAVGLI